MSNQRFLLFVESYIKLTADYRRVLELDDEGFRKFVDKMVIEISKQTYPRKLYGMSRQDVRGVVLDMLAGLFEGVTFDLGSQSIYSYETPFKEYRLVFAKTKKEVREISKKLPQLSLNTLGRISSIQKVVSFAEGGVVTDKGEYRKCIPWEHTINIFGSEAVSCV